MKITVLGCGSSTGVPMIGPDWGDCDPGNPKNRRRRASIIVETASTRVLIDTPPELREQLLDAQVDNLDAVLFTHAHADHCHGIDDLRGFNYRNDRAFDIYADAQTLTELEERFAYAFQPPKTNMIWFRPAFTKHRIDVGVPFDIGDLAILPFPQGHGSVETLGFRFGDFAYSTDVISLSDAAFGALENLDTWLVDAARYRRTHGHAWVDLTLEWIARVKPRRAVLTHMSEELDYDRLSAELPDGVEPAYDGMVIELADA